MNAGLVTQDNQRQQPRRFRRRRYQRHFGPGLSGQPLQSAQRAVVNGLERRPAPDLDSIPPRRSDRRRAASAESVMCSSPRRATAECPSHGRGTKLHTHLQRRPLLKQPGGVSTQRLTIAYVPASYPRQHCCFVAAGQRAHTVGLAATCQGVARQLNPCVTRRLDGEGDLQWPRAIQAARLSSSAFEQADAEGDDEHREYQR